MKTEDEIALLAHEGRRIAAIILKAISSEFEFDEPWVAEYHAPIKRSLRKNAARRKAKGQ
jgi:hypothetical protein